MHDIRTPSTRPPVQRRRASRARAVSFCALLLGSVASGAHAATLEVEITGVASGEGRVRVALYDAADRFMKQATASRAVDAATGSTRLRFENLAPGEYAVAAHHDLNGNDRVDTNLFGIPSEPTGFSGTPARFGPPAWPDARFALPASGLQVRIRVGR